MNALARWRLGPFSIAQLDSVTEWLDKGIALALIDVFDGTMPLEIRPRRSKHSLGRGRSCRASGARTHAIPPALRARARALADAARRLSVFAAQDDRAHRSAGRCRRRPVRDSRRGSVAIGAPRLAQSDPSARGHGALGAAVARGQRDRHARHSGRRQGLPRFRSRAGLAPARGHTRARRRLRQPEQERGRGAAWLSAKDVGALHANMVDVICAGVTVSEEPEPSGGAGATLDAAESFLECTRTDRSDGLLPTVVCDRAGVALGLVYSNHASVRVSIASGRAVYWWARTPRRFSRRPSSLARPPLRPRARCFRDASGHARATRSGAKATLRARTRPCIRSASIAIQTRCASSSNRSVLIACRLLSCSRDRRAALGHSTARRPRSATARVERAGAKREGSERSRRERARASPGRVGTPIV